MTRLLPVLAFAAVLTACGPVQSSAFLVDADVALEAARTARAEKYAPYEYTSAQLYLVKAREEVGYSDYEVAVDFARKASKFANEARQKSLQQLQNETTPPPPPPPTE